MTTSIALSAAAIVGVSVSAASADDIDSTSAAGTATITALVKPGGTPTAGFDYFVSVTNSKGEWIQGNGKKSDSGRFTISELPPGEVYVNVRQYVVGSTLPHEFAERWYPDAPSLETATALDVKPGQTVDLGTIVLPEGGRIGADVFSTSDPSANPQLYGNYDITVFRKTAGNFEQYLTFHDGGKGGAPLQDLPVGDYKVGFLDDSFGFASQYWSGKSTLSEATVVKVTKGSYEDVSADLVRPIPSLENVSIVASCIESLHGAKPFIPGVEVSFDATVPPGAAPAHVVITFNGATYLDETYTASESFEQPGDIGGAGEYEFVVSLNNEPVQTIHVSLDDSICDTPITVDRVAGADRYAVAVNISKAAYPTRASTVYVATGANYPDALAAGPAAAHDDAPLLLTDTNSLLPSVAAEIERLQPTKIIIVGGINSVSKTVEAQLKALKSKSAVVRIGGADRYEMGRNLVSYVFEKGSVSSAYVVTGANFPDALSAGPAAAVKGGPVVLVNGGASSVDQATKELLKSLGVTSLSIAGGPASVSPGVESSLKSIAPTSRQGGADRFEASVNINRSAIATSDRAFLATGLKFPDALAASAWAGSVGAPLYVTPPDCVPQATLDAIKAQGVTHVTLLGGVNTLSPAVEALKPC